MADYDQAIQLQPDLAVAYLNRGLAYKLKGEKEKAIADLEGFGVDKRPLYAVGCGGTVESVGGKVTDRVRAWEGWWRATDRNGTADEGGDQDT